MRQPEKLSGKMGPRSALRALTANNRQKAQTIKAFFMDTLPKRVSGPACLDYRFMWKVSRNRLGAIALGHFGCDLYAAETADVLGNAIKQRIGYALPVVGGFQFSRVGRIADEGDLGQNRRHVGADEDHERSLLYASVPDSRALYG